MSFLYGGAITVGLILWDSTRGHRATGDALLAISRAAFTDGLLRVDHARLGECGPPGPLSSTSVRIADDPSRVTGESRTKAAPSGDDGRKGDCIADKLER